MNNRGKAAGLVLAGLFFLAVIFVTHARTTTGAPNPSAQSDEKDISAVLDQQTADWNRGDIPAFMKGYHNAPDTEFVGPGGIKRGYDTVLERYQHSYPDRAAMGRLTFSNQTIHVLDPKAAYIVGEFHLERQSGNASGVYTLIMRKFPEGWRIVHDHSSAYPEAANNK
jgi:uncharacterized protein (TIGR02246 family)